MTAWSLAIHFLASVTTVTSAALIVPSTIIRNEIVCVLWSDSVDLISPGDLLQCRSISVVTRSLTKVKSDSQLTYDHIYSSLRRLTHLSHIQLGCPVKPLHLFTALWVSFEISSACKLMRWHQMSHYSTKSLRSTYARAGFVARLTTATMKANVFVSLGVCVSVSVDFIKQWVLSNQKQTCSSTMTVTPPLFSLFKNNAQIPLILSTTNGALNTEHWIYWNTLAAKCWIDE